jgi:hypothetical protein
MSKDCPALGDSTGVGDPIVEAIQRLAGEKFQGYHFTQSSKQKLMEGLVMAIQSRLVWYPPGVIVQELEQFEYEITRTGVRYSAPAGYHDDCVCALALAQMCRTTTAPSLVNITPDMLRQIAMASAPRR